MNNPDNNQSGVRLQKVLAAAGVASRRACEQLIAQGRVEIDGRIVREQGVRVDPSRAVVKVDGVRISVREAARYLAVNKPRGMLSAMSDSTGRPCLGDLVEHRAERLFHVGRLDADSEGLLLLTNDGELAHRLMHPSYGVRKTYLAEVTGAVPRELGRILRAGVELEDGVVRADSFRVVGRSGARVMVEIALHEGRKHIVRRLLAAVGHPVQRLVRTEIGPVKLGDLRPGKVRPLTQPEIGALFAAVER
ncbi:MAG TPA: pseudouridine synthase [Acidothermaceae bacterium]|jgi:23S rRNA pseudouridine2605 synthase